VAGSATRDSRRPADPFPSNALSALLRRLPRYARLGWRLGRDPAMSRGRRAAVLAAAAYLASPIDLVPGIIPVAGQLDDAAVGLVALRFALRGLPPDRRAAHLAAVNLSMQDLEADLLTVRRTTAWILRRGAILSVRAGAALARGGMQAARGLRRASLASLARVRAR
jgi:uncharacterized membrane protein YkvA (DUF1232 family)